MSLLFGMLVVLGVIWVLVVLVAHLPLWLLALTLLLVPAGALAGARSSSSR